MRKFTLLSVMFLCNISIFAQYGDTNPFAEYGYTKKNVYTSSKGEFQEFHDNDSIVEICSVLFNVKTGQIVRFLAPEKLEQYVPASEPATSVDPLAEKYWWITPYAYCLNNPINAIDPDGRDVVVLNAPGGASGFGHMGILIGNDKDGWTYMSKDGGSHLWGLVGSSKFDNNNGKLFNRIVDFELSENIRRKDGVNGNGEPYQRGIRFETTSEQDETAKAAMEKSGRENYNILTNNCADAVTEALKSVGIDPGYNDNGNIPMKPNEQFEKISTNNNAKIITIAPKILLTPKEKSSEIEP